MPIKTLGAGKESTLKTSGLYLSILGATGTFFVSSPAFNTLVGKTGRIYKLDNVTEVTLTNPGQTDVTIEYEVANIEVQSAGGGEVSVGNAVVIEKINQPFQVETSATVDGGSVGLLSGQILTPLPVISVPANSARKIADARAVIGRKITLQNISATFTKLHIGTNDSINGTAGTVLVGSIDAIGTAEVTNETEIWVYNDSSEPALVASQEEYINDGSPAPVVDVTPPTNLLSNDNFVTDTNADGVPDGWTKSVDGTATLASTALANGNTLTLSTGP